jgi:hypothetical protein
MAGHPVILLIPPQILAVNPIIKQALALHNLTSFEEIEPKAGCRRFRLT